MNKNLNVRKRVTAKGGTSDMTYIDVQPRMGVAMRKNLPRQLVNLTSMKISIKMPKPYQRKYDIFVLSDICLTVYFNAIGEWVLDFPLEVETTTLNSGLKLNTWRRAH